MQTAIHHYGMEVLAYTAVLWVFDKDVSFTDKSLSGLLNQGGTVLGTSRESLSKNGGFRRCKQACPYSGHIEELGLIVWCASVGNGTQKTAARGLLWGVNIASVNPKTIDNDIWGTDFPWILIRP